MTEQNSRTQAAIVKEATACENGPSGEADQILKNNETEELTEGIFFMNIIQCKKIRRHSERRVEREAPRDTGPHTVG